MLNTAILMYNTNVETIRYVSTSLFKIPNTVVGSYRKHTGVDATRLSHRIHVCPVRNVERCASTVHYRVKVPNIVLTECNYIRMHATEKGIAVAHVITSAKGPSTTATPSKYLVSSIICRRYEEEVCMFGCDQIVRANPCSSTRKCEDVYEWCLQRSQEHQASIKRLNVNTMRNNIKNVVELVANNSSDPTTTIAATTTDPRDAVSSIDCRRYEQEVCMFGCDQIVRANPCSSTRKCEDVYKWCLRRSQRHLASIKRFNVNTMRNNIKNVELVANNSSDPTTTIAAATTDPRDAGKILFPISMFQCQLRLRTVTMSSTVCRRNEEEVCRIACDRIVRANPCSSTRKCEDVYKRCLRRCQEDFRASLKQLVVNTMRKNIKNVTGLAMNNSSDPTTTTAATTTDPRDAGPSTTATPANYLGLDAVGSSYQTRVRPVADVNTCTSGVLDKNIWLTSSNLW
ncbi:unnamed protein product [Anisakis simplex]|uniref:ShKT domain-containing protein n=1 Tax=Anisakis simplex TaxID=6269 RepID=A0A0M3IZ87_ANISI|nr:unnamed protein product [Anisakis simplex]